jgi:UDP:flavonoid glycosyltransferase YjiC (YdhE family)
MHDRARAMSAEMAKEDGTGTAVKLLEAIAEEREQGDEAMRRQA